MKVLVVDDEEAARYLIASLLKGHGYEVVEAADGREALDKARAEPVDIVVTDILMPNMDGYQLCREWKADPELSKAPLVFYSATYTEPADEKFAESLGADAFFVKPQEPDVLVRLIEDVLEQHAAKHLEARPAEVRGEEEILREYSERLVSKLEQKIVELNKANKDLKNALEVLSDEVEVKGQLIDKLTTDMQQQEQQRAEAAASKGQLDAMIASSPVGIIMVDAQGLVSQWNPVAEQILGWTAEEAVGRTYEATPEQTEVIEGLLKGATTLPLGRQTWNRKDGSEVSFDSSAAPVRDASGTVLGFVSMMWNPSE